VCVYYLEPVAEARDCRPDQDAGPALLQANLSIASQFTAVQQTSSITMSFHDSNTCIKTSKFDQENCRNKKMLHSLGDYYSKFLLIW
jgi:hypothetical protein